MTSLSLKSVIVNTASASDSEISADEVISNGVSKGENVVENVEEGDDEDENEDEKLKRTLSHNLLCI